MAVFWNGPEGQSKEDPETRQPSVREVESFWMLLRGIFIAVLVAVGVLMMLSGCAARSPLAEKGTVVVTSRVTTTTTPTSTITETVVDKTRAAAELEYRLLELQASLLRPVVVRGADYRFLPMMSRPPSVVRWVPPPPPVIRSSAPTARVDGPTPPGSWGQVQKKEGG